MMLYRVTGKRHDHDGRTAGGARVRARQKLRAVRPLRRVLENHVGLASIRSTVSLIPKLVDAHEPAVAILDVAEFEPVANG